jgi:hypothetical protein
MENYDPRRRQSSDDRSRHYPHNEERGRDRESWRPDDERNRRRASSEETGWLDYDRNPDRTSQRYEDRGRDEQRYGDRGGSERSTFSPDWSREGAEPRYSDDPYYSRNRDRGDRYSEYSRSGSRGRGDDRSQWEQRSRESIPREQRELAERSRSGDYYSPDWPYERGNQDRDQRGGQGRYMQRASEDEQGSHYRGYYSRSAAPFAYPGGQGYMYSESITLHGPYTGRGPKGYKRSDQQIIEEASQRLERDGEIDASEIEVTAEDGVITLRGHVPDRRTKRRAEECVESVYGARDVMNELKCGSQSQSSSSGEWQGAGTQSAQGSQRSQSSKGSQSATSTGRGGTTTASGSEQPSEKPKH